MSSNAVAFYSNGLPYDINGAIVATVSWSPLSLLLEDSSYLLLEDGSKLLLEA
jgi:hypothetical protein